MDPVRFGRVLGTGTRLVARTAAKTLVTAVDAATAPNPSAPASASPPRRTVAEPSAAEPLLRDTFQNRSVGSVSPQPQSRGPATVENPLSSHTPHARQAARNSARGIAQGSRRFGHALWGPVAKLSGVLWLEFTGVFFGLFALSAAVGAWKLRADLHPSAPNPEARFHLFLALAVAILFGYFCISSFVRASRRGRRS